VQERTFTGSTFAHDRNLLAPLDNQVKVAEHGDFTLAGAIGFREPFDLYHRIGSQAIV
jgi:hypothetical protein